MESRGVANGKKVVQTDTAPKALGPYSQAIAAGGMIYCAGQIPLDPKTGNIVAGGVGEQTHQVLKNLRAVLKAAAEFGASRPDLKSSEVLKIADSWIRWVEGE